MTLPVLLSAVARYEGTALTLHHAQRVLAATGRAEASRLARENRDVARRMHLEAYADALVAGWVLS